MELTPRGLSLVEPVREALLRIQATLGTQPSFAGHRSPHLHTHRIRGMPCCESSWPYSKGLAKEAPGITCHVEHFSETTLSRLEYGDADLYLGLKQPAAVWPAGVSRHLAHVF